MQRNQRQIYTSDAKFSIVASTPDGESSPRLTGYPIVWGALSDDRGGYRVRINKGAVKFTSVFRALKDHVGTDILGTNENGTLRWTEDDIGVKVEIDLPNTTLGRDTLELVSKKYVQGMSFSMVSLPWSVRRTPKGAIVKPLAGKAEVETSSDGTPIVTALDFECDEVSVTADNSFIDATVGVDRFSTYEGHPTRTAQRLQLDRFKITSLGWGLCPVPSAHK